MKPARARRLVIFAAIVAIIFILVGCAPTTREASNVDSGPGDSGGAEATGTVNAGAQYAEGFMWDASADCAACHTTEEASLTNSKTTASLHSAQGLDCSFCHADTSGLTTAHKSATSSSKMPTRLVITEIAEKTCLSSGCHVSRENLLQLTAESKALTDSAGTVVNPHDLPLGGDHSDFTCGDCHAVHEEKPVEKVAKDNCVSCHHQDVFECNTCHEG